VRILYMWFLISAMLAARGTAVAQIVRPGTKSTSDRPVTSITISPLHDSLKVGYPVLVNITVTNTSNHDGVEITRLRSGADSQIDVRDANGKLAPDTSFGYVHNGHVAQPDLDPARFSAADLADNATGGATLNAKEATTWSINVSRFYDMSQPGKYSIRIQRGDPEDLEAFVKSNTITVMVTP
jgi:hypothetical protein